MKTITSHAFPIETLDIPINRQVRIPSQNVITGNILIHKATEFIISKKIIDATALVESKDEYPSVRYRGTTMFKRALVVEKIFLFFNRDGVV